MVAWRRTIQLPLPAALLLAVLVFTVPASASRNDADASRPHLFFVEGSLGGGWNAAFDRERSLVDAYGEFYWYSAGDYYRYRPSNLILTAGFGYEYLLLPYLGLRAAYSYTSYLNYWSAGRSSGSSRRSSTVGGQVAETGGYFIGTVLRYPMPWIGGFYLEAPILWGMHRGSYYPLPAYSEFRNQTGRMPQHPDEFTTQPLVVTKWRYGLGIAFLREGFPLYASLQFLMESGRTVTVNGPEQVLPAGSAWDAFIATLAVGWRL
ncbi:MAG: hypothetical protein OHK0011_19750 [Turneriella sp.]